jgi:hypothetical protein
MESGDHKILAEIQATMILSQATNCKKNKGLFAENNQLDSFVQFVILHGYTCFVITTQKQKSFLHVSLPKTNFKTTTSKEKRTFTISLLLGIE